MKTLIDQLSNYADYHRDPRNIVTHYIGVPMIMQAVVILLARLQWGAPGGSPISLALLAAVAAAVYYWRLDGRYGLFMSVLLAAMLLAQVGGEQLLGGLVNVAHHQRHGGGALGLNQGRGRPWAEPGRPAETAI